MATILLTTLNAKYIHSSFGLRYLRANLGKLRDQSLILEFDIHNEPLDVAYQLLSYNPKIIGFGVYLWNLRQITEIVHIIKSLRKDIYVIVGGPEVSYEPYPQPIVELADYVLAGEADLTFPIIAEALLKGDTISGKVIHCPIPPLERIVMPYDEYSLEDLEKRLVYVEASRGCPIGCEFCISSVNPILRRFPLPEVLNHLERLISRGARRLVFVDRSFNISLKLMIPILEFFLGKQNFHLQIHFELLPHILSTKAKEYIKNFPPGMLRLEVGVQTLNEEINRRIGRYQPQDLTLENLAFLCQETGAHVHLDIIVGLPGEDLESISKSFDRLVELEPDEIQVGILKLLRGAPIRRHIESFKMIFSPAPPYEIIQTSTISFEELQLMRAFARYWELYYNSGHFRRTLKAMWQSRSPFWTFYNFTRWLFERIGRRHAISIESQAYYLATYIKEELHKQLSDWVPAILTDYLDEGRRHLTPYLRKLAIEAGVEFGFYK